MHIFILIVRGSTLVVRMILTIKVDPRTVRVDITWYIVKYRYEDEQHYHDMQICYHNVTTVIIYANIVIVHTLYCFIK